MIWPIAGLFIASKLVFFVRNTSDPKCSLGKKTQGQNYHQMYTKARPFFHGLRLWALKCAIFLNRIYYILRNSNESKNKAAHMGSFLLSHCKTVLSVRSELVYLITGKVAPKIYKFYRTLWATIKSYPIRFLWNML